MRRIRYLFHQVFQKVRAEKRRYVLYVFSFYAGLLLPAFCIANIRSVDRVIYYTTFEGMENTVQIDWLGERFDAVDEEAAKGMSVSAYYEEDMAEWNHQYVLVEGIDGHYFYPLPKVSGRTFAENEFENGENVCLLNRRYAREYSCGIGDKVKLREEQFEVIGLMEDEYSGIILPYRAMERAYRKESLIQFSCIVPKGAAAGEKDAAAEKGAAKGIARQIEGADETAEILEVTQGETLYENALAAKMRWRFLRGAAAGAALLFFILNESIVLTGKLENEQQVIGVNMALGAAEGEVKLCLLFETLMLTAAAVSLVLLTAFPLAKIFGLGSAVVLDREAVFAFSVMSFLMCGILTWAAMRAVRRKSISMMLRVRDMQ